jgi:hypothetical protein
VLSKASVICQGRRLTAYRHSQGTPGRCTKMGIANHMEAKATVRKRSIVCNHEGLPARCDEPKFIDSNRYYEAVLCEEAKLEKRKRSLDGTDS